MIPIGSVAPPPRSVTRNDTCSGVCPGVCSTRNSIRPTKNALLCFNFWCGYDPPLIFLSSHWYDQSAPPSSDTYTFAPIRSLNSRAPDRKSAWM